MAETLSAPLSLAADFPPADHARWRELVEAVLKGRPFERLVSRSHDGLAIAPLYAPAADARAIAGRAPARCWQIVQRLDHPDPAAANIQALHDLENGATGLALVFAGSVGAHGFGITPTGDALARALEGVDPQGAALDLDLPADAATAQAAVEAVLDLVERNRSDPALTLIRFGLDPIGAAALRGTPLDWPAAGAALAGTIGDLSARGFCGPFAAADGRIVHAAGGSEAQELAYVLCVALACLRALERAGIDLDAARRAIAFRLAADADQLLTIAKFRALRRLWASVEAACGLAPVPAAVTGETSWRMMTRRDPHVNLLRGTIAVFSAGVGGADAITALPFTSALGLPDGFARRIARNTQLVLAEESHLARVADPAAGSGAIEGLTADLCDAAWTLFQQVERAGGIAATLASGLLQEKIAATRTARQRAVATRREPLTGVSEFPNLREAPASVLMPAPPAAEPATGALAPMRLAEPFEALRDRSDAILARTGARPKVLLACLGRPADFLARATFAQNFFEAGGIEAVNAGEPAPADAQHLAGAFRSSGAPLACLCSSDDVYAQAAVAAAAALSAAGAKVWLAGRLPDLEAGLREAGVSEFIHAGCDMPEVLARAHAAIDGTERHAAPAGQA